jgi:acetyltransferase-like isoleucine patch superfamily enzyme
MLYRIFSTLYIAVIFGAPTSSILGIMLATPGWARLTVIGVGPVLFAVLFGLVAGLLSVPHQKWIIPGRFPRDLSSALYRGRRLYGLCWTAVYYFKPVYWIWLSIPGGSSLLFKLFGYRGPSSFATYPDTWIRDLPLLRLGPGAYLSNRATIGTNIVLKNGDILVDGITIERGAVIGHLTMLGPGVFVGEDAEVGVGCGVGIGSRIEAGAEIAPTSTIEHGVIVGRNSRVGTYSYIGSGSLIGPDLRIPPGTIVPPRSRIETAAALERFLTRAAQLADAGSPKPSSGTCSEHRT